MEQCADAAVAESGEDSASIAMTLVNVKRLSLSKSKMPSQDSICYFSNEEFESRIRSLLSLPQANRVPIALVSLLLLTLVVCGGLVTDSLHHSIELLLAI